MKDTLLHPADAISNGDPCPHDLGAFLATDFCVMRWALWCPSTEGARAEVPEIPELLRRRASNTARAGLRAAFDCFPEKEPVATVFCSRHGEVHRSVQLLEQLSRGETLSPTSFSLSVHSAAATLFSISRKDKSPVSVISAGADSLAMGLLESVARLHDGEAKVLLVAHDELVPTAFQPWTEAHDTACGFAMLLCKQGPKRFSMTLEATPEVGDDSIPLQLQLADFLISNESELRVDSGLRTWVFRRDA